MITIDRVNRQMRIPDADKILGVVSDGESRTLYFTCPVILDPNFDATNASIYINYRRSDGEIGQYLVLDKQINYGSCTFSWIVSRATYAIKGTLDFIVCMKIIDEEGSILKEWNTTLGHLTVLEGLEPEGEVTVPPAEKDLILQLINYVDETTDKAVNEINQTKDSALEAINKAIDDVSKLGYCNENILINSDFKSGIINQKGETTYTITQVGGKFNYFIDRWKVWVETGRTFTCTVNQGSIDVKIEGIETGAMQQDVNLEKGTQYVITAKIDGELRQLSFVGGETKQDDYIKASGSGADGYVCVIFGNTTRNVEFVKLEKGLVFTGMPVWNKTEELLKCKRFLQVLTPSDTVMLNGIGTSTSYVILPLSIGLNKNPTVEGLKNQQVKTTTSNGQVTTTITNVSVSKITPSGLLLVLDVASYTNMANYTPVIFELKHTSNVILDANEY